MRDASGLWTRLAGKQLIIIAVLAAGLGTDASWSVTTATAAPGNAKQATKNQRKSGAKKRPSKKTIAPKDLAAPTRDIDQAIATRSEADLCRELKAVFSAVEIFEIGEDTRTGWPMARVRFPEREETQRLREANERRNNANQIMAYVFEAAALVNVADSVNILETADDRLATLEAGRLPKTWFQGRFAWKQFVFWGDNACLNQIRLALGLPPEKPLPQPSKAPPAQKRAGTKAPAKKRRQSGP